MQRNDYEKISKIIEDVVGKDTLMCIRLLEGIKFYFDKKEREIQIIRTDSEPITFQAYKVSEWKKGADRAMKRYTNKLKKEAKIETEACSITG